MEYAVQTKNLSKQYPGVLANDNVSINIVKNTIHAIVGENGAGKSTLVKMLYGIVPKTSGKIMVNGKLVEFAGAQDAINAGVGMVHQHFRLIPSLTVGENIMLGNEPGSKYYLNRSLAYEKIKNLSQSYGLNLEPSDMLESISIGQKQKTEIMRALYVGSEILILDEPTAVLTPQEIYELEGIVKKLKKQGKTIIIITHKLEEVMDFTDNISVMRLGKNVGELVTKKTSPSEIIKLMVGRSVTLGGNKNTKNTNSHEEIIKVQNLNYVSAKGKSLKDIDFTVYSGEIVGIAGVDGSGQGELLEIISGISHQKSGKIIMNGVDLEKYSIKERKENSFGYIPQDRHAEGLLMNFSIEQNILLGSEDKKTNKNKYGFLDLKHISDRAKKLINDYDIRTPNEKILISHLSGGNQQKVIIARETADNPHFILAAQPTRGLDIGAIEFVHNVLSDLRNEGSGILVVSYELDELIELCDRIIVFCAGKITGKLIKKDFDREKIGFLMVGETIE